MTFLAALRCDRIDAPCVLDQPIKSATFLDYVEQFLVPTLSAGGVVTTSRVPKSQQFVRGSAGPRQ